MCKPRLVGFKALSKTQRIMKSGIEISDERKTKKDKDELMKIVYGRALPSLARFEGILKLRPIQTETKISTKNRRGVKGIEPSSVKGEFFFYFSHLETVFQNLRLTNGRFTKSLELVVKRPFISRKFWETVYS